MDGNLGVGAPHWRSARSHHPPRQHPRDEWRQLSSRPKPRPKGRLKPLAESPRAYETPLGLRPPGGLTRTQTVAWFYSAHWPDFAPPLTGEGRGRQIRNGLPIRRPSPRYELRRRALLVEEPRLVSSFGAMVCNAPCLFLRLL